MKRRFVYGFLVICLCLGYILAALLHYDTALAAETETKQKVRAYFPNLDLAHKAVISLETLESDYAKGYLVMALTREEIDTLTNLGFRIAVLGAFDIKTQSAIIKKAPDATVSGIPGYACYRTVEETYAAAEAIAADHPTLASWIDVGDSWEKANDLGGYDMMVLKLTNTAIAGPKPKLFITSAIHAREYTPAELCTRFAEKLVGDYGNEADATWILDYHEVHLMLHANPDGRKIAEAGHLWRKNTNRNVCVGNGMERGVDLNRNFAFNWGCCDGSSRYHCHKNYRGQSAGSEPETQAIQNYVRSLFADNRGPDPNDPAPEDTSGIYLDIHSSGGLILWPWAYTDEAAPNRHQLRTLGKKFAYWSGYTPMQSIGFSLIDGSSEGIGYGELGIASFTFELGTTFFQDCNDFTDTIVPDNMPSLVYAAKTVRSPYLIPAGPDVYNLALSAGATSPGVPPGTAVTLTTMISDTRYSTSGGSEPTQNITEARCYVGIPPWEGGSAIPMQASDGSFDTETEQAEAVLDTSGWGSGKHIVFVQGRDADGNWGATSAIFIFIKDTVAYCVSSGGNNQFGWIAGVQVGPLNKRSEGSGYSDYTIPRFNLAAGARVPVSLTPGFQESSTYDENWNIWIDYNADGDFDDTGELVFSGSDSTTVNGTFTIPASVSVELTRMRVAMRYNNAPPVCGSFDYGEVEDYAVGISPAPAPPSGLRID